MGFDLNSAINDGIDKAKDAVNEKVGQEVVNEEQAQQVKDAAAGVAGKLTEKFGGQ
ncbi:ribosome recycling factor [Rothia nasimurium]|uniref:ribosome recycling factor n=1 Tax=Rothia nasimurium TaxID=85336 RepID=UPI001F33725D|nr:ribosome recycling factor [Rothia nasimurium]